MDELKWRQHCAERFYTPLSSEGELHRRVGWESQLAHQLRLRTLLAAIAPLDGLKTVLDVGCGEGALLALLEDAGYQGSYLGEDILCRMVVNAQKRFSQHEFLCCDSLNGGPMADAVICSGTLNTTVDTDDHTGYVIRAVESLWERTRIVLAVDFVVEDRHSPGAQIGRCDIERLWSAVRKLSRVATISEAGIPGEGFLVMRRNHRLAYAALQRPEDDPLHIAEILLQGGEATAAQGVLGGHSGDLAELLRGICDFQLGRVLRAEDVLRQLADRSSLRGKAQVNLAVLCQLTHRSAEAQRILQALISDVSCDAEDRDAARLLLARMLLQNGEALAGAEVAAAIETPWIAREAAGLLES